MSNFNVDYYINEEKKVIVAKLTCCDGGLVCDMCKAGYEPIPPFFIKDEFVGKAKCSDEDTFDVEIGKKIAFKRAFVKYTETKKKALVEFIEDFNKAHKAINEDVNKIIANYEHKISNRQSEIDKLIG